MAPKKSNPERGGQPSVEDDSSRSPEISEEEVSGVAPNNPVSPMTALILDTLPNDHVDSDIRPMGFRNGPTPDFPSQICYRNSAMTMLLNLPCFTNWLASGYPTGRSKSFAKNIMDTLQLLASVYWSPDGGIVEEKRWRLDAAMDLFWKTFLKANPDFTEKPKNNYFVQEDSALFLALVLDSALEQLDKDSDDGKILGSLFRASLANSRFCSGGCQKKRERREVYGIPIPNDPSFIHIVNFQTTEIKSKRKKRFQQCFDASLKQQQDVYCPRCEKQVDRSARDSFISLPPILLTQLSRSTASHGKIQTPCEIPQELSVPIDDSVVEKYKNHRYRLAGVVAHIGNTSKAGHYISYVRDPKTAGSWIELDDNTVRQINFEDISHNKRDKRILPYVLAWELIDESSKTAKTGNDGEVSNGGEDRTAKAGEEEGSNVIGDEKEQRLNEKEEELNEREAELEKMELGLNEKEERLNGVEEELREMEEGLHERDAALDAEKMELDLNEKEEWLNQVEEELREMEEGLHERDDALDLRKIELNEIEDALSTREEALIQREKALDTGNDKPSDREEALIRRENGLNESVNQATAKDTSKNASQEEAVNNAEDQVVQEVDEGSDTATFCATFRNVADREERARAIFKLHNFDPAIPTKIESTVQLSDLEGNLRSIKKGTTVNDEFIVIFNVKGGKKRKRGDGDEACLPSPLRAKTTKPAKEADRPLIPPCDMDESNAKKEAAKSTKIKIEPKSPKGKKDRTKKSTAPTRSSARINKGKRAA